MNNDINLTARLKQKMGSRPRVRGRYNSSELYFINHGQGKLKVTPESWLNQPDRPIKDILNMWSGIGLHNQLEELLGKEHSEKKVEYKYKDITLVGKADFMPPHKDEVWEFKTSEKLMEEAKPWHISQVKLYTTMFEKPLGVIYQPIQDSDGVYLKHLGTVERDDEWVEKELELLYQFHLKIEKLWEAKK